MEIANGNHPQGRAFGGRAGVVRPAAGDGRHAVADALLLEARGVLDWVVVRLAPLLKPSVDRSTCLAALQINFVSFAAPLATLTMMEQRGASDRHIAATLAMASPCRRPAALPMMTMGLGDRRYARSPLIGGLAAAAATYYLFGRALVDGRRPA